MSSIPDIGSGLGEFLESQLAALRGLRRNRSVLYRCPAARKKVRVTSVVSPRRLGRRSGPSRLVAGLCLPSRIPAFVTLSRTVRANRERILAAVELGLSNSKLEGLNSKIRLIKHRGYGHHSAAADIAMIDLCCGGITVAFPSRDHRYRT